MQLFITILLLIRITGLDPSNRIESVFVCSEQKPIGLYSVEKKTEELSPFCFTFHSRLSPEGMESPQSLTENNV